MWYKNCRRLHPLPGFLLLLLIPLLTKYPPVVKCSCPGLSIQGIVGDALLWIVSLILVFLLGRRRRQPVIIVRQTVIAPPTPTTTTPKSVKSKIKNNTTERPLTRSITKKLKKTFNSKFFVVSRHNFGKWIIEASRKFSPIFVIKKLCWIWRWVFFCLLRLFCFDHVSQILYE